MLALLLAARLAGGARISPTEARHLVGVRVRPFLFVFFDERLRLCPAGQFVGSELGVVERVADGPFAKLVQQRAHIAGGSELHLLHDDGEIGEPELRQGLPETLSDERSGLHKLLVSRLLHEAECAAVPLLAGMEREGEAQHRAVRSPEERTLEIIGEFVLQGAVVAETFYFALEDGR